MAGLDPAIQQHIEVLCFSWIAASSVAMTAEFFRKPPDFLTCSCAGMTMRR
jgi:hypothetical protein